MNPGNGIETAQLLGKFNQLVAFNLMNPGNGIETQSWTGYKSLSDFQLNESRQRDWNITHEEFTIYQAYFQLNESRQRDWNIVEADSHDWDEDFQLNESRQRDWNKLLSTWLNLLLHILST